jgi:uncharacterized protein (DUF849 family)
MLLQATLNGPFTKADHPAVPESVEELTRDAVACVAAGARAFHIHPRDADGRERLDPDVVDGVVSTVKAACAMPVGVTTGEWIEPDPKRRCRFISQWRTPDYTSVNLSERGSVEVMRACLEAGIGIEAGVCTVEDAEKLVESELGPLVTRIMIEPVDVPAVDAVALVDAIHAVLDLHGLVAPRLQHGDGEATWVLLSDAVRRGIDTRIGLEDTLYDPDGTLTAGNSALVAAAVLLGAGGVTGPATGSR